ncbi:virulence factor family protein [Mesorhizobium sp. AR07]|uniref:AcvB/VirJ family lysyl-phosphatidylglycerol hydrolase n=1 Tax=Mesorhizobium sp. AR07 TaxID=2865838 RepID=UPI00215E85A7|nr:AcvB/VirJ family lysyl-phosphatidylglycerol hydrolase [Mesorhizobium sp. AR07]UVK42784.1 virulence factor family protein [Mesorhizobium sp. AR07]
MPLSSSKRLKPLAAFLFVAVASISSPGPAAEFNAGMVPTDRIALPAQPPKLVVFLFSALDGWSPADEDLSKRLVERGAAVVGIDMPRYLASIDKAGGDCVYLVSDIETLSHEVMRSGKASVYQPPILAGFGTAGGLVMGIAAQTPPATIGGSVAVDPTETFPSTRMLCSGAPRKDTANGIVYDLLPGQLPEKLDVVFTPSGSPEQRSHIDKLIKQGHAINLTQSTNAAADALESAVDILIAQGAGSISDLPIVELPATPTEDTLAIVYSGDGGWRDIDKSIATILQSKGIPTIGIDSLRYFWSAKTPQAIATDLENVIATYKNRWHVKHVLLVGYSFGADVLPSVYNVLDKATADDVVQISLLGFSAGASFEISVEGWLGSSSSGETPTLPELRKIDLAMVQCFYGEDEDDTACPQLVGTRTQTIKTTGGHHFDGDYNGLTQTIIDGLHRRLAAQPVP